MKLWGLALLIVTLVGLAGCRAAAPGVPGAPKGLVEKGVVGQPSKLHRVAVTVHSADLHYMPKSQFDTPAAGNRYVAVDVEVQNIGTSPVMRFEFDQPHLVDDSGRSYSTTISDASPALLDAADNLPPGDKARGFVTFEVPLTSTHLALRYSVDAAENSLTQDTLNVPLD